MFTKELKQAGHSRRFTIQEAPGEGWEVREEADSRLVKVVQLRDWHRVERRRKLLEATDVWATARVAAPLILAAALVP